MCREWRPGGGVFLLRWVRLNDYDVARVRHKCVVVLDERLRCGQRVRGWIRAAFCVQLQCRLCINLERHDSMCREHRNVSDNWLQRGQCV